MVCYLNAIKHDKYGNPAYETWQSDEQIWREYGN